MNLWYPDYVRYHKVRLAHDLDIVQSLANEGDKVLDAGCIPPLLLTTLSEAGFNASGLDIAPGRFKGCIRELGLRVEQCDLEQGDIPIEPGTQDVVIFNEIFEHLRFNPIKSLERLIRVLRPGGSLLLSTPNLYSAQGLLNLILRRRAEACSADPFLEYAKLEELGHMGHVREYTDLEVTTVLQRLGLQVYKIIHRGRSEHRFERAVESLVPRMRPFMSIVARRPETDAR